jgi:hypothetical protein
MRALLLLTMGACCLSPRNAGAQAVGEQKMAEILTEAVSVATALFPRPGTRVLAVDGVTSVAPNLPIPASARIGEKVAARLGLAARTFDEVRKCTVDAAGKRNCRIEGVDLVISATLKEVDDATAVVVVSYGEPLGSMTVLMTLQKEPHRWSLKRIENVITAH